MMNTQAKISIVTPIHDMKDGEKFLWRLVNSLTEQTFKDWELIISKDGKMAENTNAGIRRAKGEIIKVLYLDDYLLDPTYLENLVYEFDGGAEWVICGTDDNPHPVWTDNIIEGNNRLGSPSALAFRNYLDGNVLFDETMSWLLDCDLYHRLHKIAGLPVIMPGTWVGIGKGDHQMTHILTDDEKLSEHKYMSKKYEVTS